MDVAKRVMDLRNEAGFSKGELARRAGLAESYIGQIESKKKHPTVDTIFRICSGLDITIQEFFSIEQDLSALPPDLHKFVTKKENRDMLRFISEMKEKGYTSEGITDILGSLQKIVDDAIKGNNQVSFTDVQEDTDKLLKDFTNKKNKKSK
jgi:transcriptional regulator with XRE-family HTH domain